MTGAIEPDTRTQRVMLSKVPEITVWFWAIKILCTTVGETFADWVNTGLGLGLYQTAALFTVVLATALGVQLRVDRYVPVVYWLTVVVFSVAGTLYTDILTDSMRVPLALSTFLFTVALAVVFGVWFARERTLSIHSITTLPREGFYWLAVLVTFALGTAAGDWTLSITGWGPGVAVLLPAGLLGAVILGWRFGIDAVLSFWVGYVLTRPLGANLGDWLAAPAAENGLGLGHGATSVVFLVAIAGAVGYLTVTHVDVIDVTAEKTSGARSTAPVVTAGYYAVLVVATSALLHWAGSQSHQSAAIEGEDLAPGQPAASAVLDPAQVKAAMPEVDLALFRTIATDTLAKVTAGDQSAAKARITDLETAWDNNQSTLQPAAPYAWSVIDHQIDAALRAVRSSAPSVDDEKRALSTLLTTLG